MRHVIYGPPGSGKSYLAKELAGRSGIVVDLDLIAAAMNMPARYPRTPYQAGMLICLRDAVAWYCQSSRDEEDVVMIVTEEQSARAVAERIKARLHRACYRGG